MAADRPAERGPSGTGHDTAGARCYVRSHMGLVHAVIGASKQAVCGTAIRDSWEPIEVDAWASEPNVCRSCDDVLMARGRKSHHA